MDKKRVRFYIVLVVHLFLLACLLFSGCRATAGGDELMVLGFVTSGNVAHEQAIVGALHEQGISATFEGSRVSSILVKSYQAERALKVLKTNLEVSKDREVILFEAPERLK